MAFLCRSLFIWNPVIPLRLRAPWRLSARISLGASRRLLALRSRAAVAGSISSLRAPYRLRPLRCIAA